MPESSDSLAPSGAPTHHLKIWSDGGRLYCEIPGVPPKPAYITTFIYDSRGIDLILSLTGQHRVNYDYKGEIPSGYTGRSNFKHGTDVQDALAEKILREMRILK